jgi:hypothetical protein
MSTPSTSTTRTVIRGSIDDMVDLIDGFAPQQVLLFAAVGFGSSVLLERCGPHLERVYDRPATVPASNPLVFMHLIDGTAEESWLHGLTDGAVTRAELGQMRFGRVVVVLPAQEG